MKSMIACSAVLGAASLSCAGVDLQTVGIDFDDQPGGVAPPVETDGQFSPYATFSTQADHVLLIFSGAGFVGGSNPNVLTAAENISASSYDSDIYVDFNDAVQNLSLDILSDNDAGAIASLRVFHAGGETLLDVVGNANFNDAIPTDLSAYADVTRIELIDITDEFGLSIDNLVFDVPIPAPGVLGAFAGLAVCTGRRRR
jgi:hypothetical protein